MPLTDYTKIIDLVFGAKIFFEPALNEKDIHMKGNADFVTAADLNISRFFKKELKNIDPSIGFLTEEESGSLTDPCWILDPIDGTANYVYGYNMSSISLGLYADGEMQFGAVYNPFSEECFTAQKGKGAYLGKKRLCVSNREIGRSLIEFGAGSTRKDNADTNFAIAKEIFQHCVDLRRICSSALDFCYIAAGRIDGYFEQVLKPWDIAAGSLILTEANGTLTDYKGNPCPFTTPTSVVASNGKIHPFLLKTISAYS